MQTLDRFAAHLAHELNQNESGFCWIEAGHIYSDLIDLLATRYAGTLLYHGRYTWRMDAHEAASRYFDCTIGRKLWLSGKSPYSSAHIVLLQLVRRLPNSGWQMATLERHQSPPESSYKVLIPKSDVVALQNRFDRLGHDISYGNAAHTIQKRDGFLWLCAGQINIKIPEELSLWDAITAIPPRLTLLSQGEEFNVFCGKIIDVVRTANRPFQELLGLAHSLCPFDWLDVLSTSQVRSMRKYLNSLPEDLSLYQLSMQEARNHWEKHPVAGFKNFEEFWNSEIGWTLRSPPLRPYQGELDDLEVTEIANEVDDLDVLSQSEWISELDARVNSGAIEPIERQILLALYRGTTFSQLDNDPELTDWLFQNGGALAWSQSLQQRFASRG